MASRAKRPTGAKKSTAAASSRGARRGGAKSTDKGELSKDPLPPTIYAQVSPRSVGGVSMFEGQDQINSTTVFNFFSEGDLVNAAVARLREAGFEILQISPLTINIAGSAATYRRAFGTNIAVFDRPVVKDFGTRERAEF